MFTVPEIVTPAGAGDGPPGPDPEDEQVRGPGRRRWGDPAARPARRRAPQDRPGGDGLRDRPRRRTFLRRKPGVTNLLDILAACGGSAAGLATYGALKAAVTDAVVAELEPIQKRYADLAADPAYVADVFAAGAERCRQVTAPVLLAAEAAIGLR